MVQNLFLCVVPAVTKIKVKSDPLQRLVAFYCLGNGHFHLVAQKLRHLVAGFDLG